jgi:xanthine dehydrogenase accessory factor
LINIFEEITKLLSDEKRVVLARIVRQTGSAPRSLGTKFLVLEDASIIGTIGGGSLEHQVIEKAKDVFRQGKSALLHVQMTGKEVAQSEMLCGGNVDVFLEPLFPQNKTVRELFQTAGRVMLQEPSCTLLTQVAEGIDFDTKNCRMLVDAHGTKIGGLGEGVLKNKEAQLKQLCTIRRPTLVEMESTAEQPAVFIEPLQPDDVLYLFGGGHISTFVAHLAKMVGFRVVVIDDRKAFANAQRFPNADNLIVCPFQKAFQQLSINASSYIAIITRGHIHDREVLRSALGEKPAYLGMVGSLRKRNLIYQAMRQEGISQKRLDQVHCPIGLDIHAETPEEIAISIVAELIQTKARGAMEEKST